VNAWGLSEVERRLANMVKIGVISAVDHAAKKIRVEAGGMNSAWLPWPVEMGRNFRRWRPLREGQQVVMVAPSGELAQATIICMLYSSSLDAPSTNPDLDLIEFEDGTRLQYDSSSHHLTAECVGNVTVKTPTLVTIDSPQTTVTGKLTVQGLLTYQAGMAGSGGTGTTASIQGNVKITGGDLTADGISVKKHTHPGDSGGTTGPAQ